MMMKIKCKSVYVYTVYKEYRIHIYKYRIPIHFSIHFITLLHFLYVLMGKLSKQPRPTLAKIAPQYMPNE
jgi:hypothetical protein